MPEPKRAPLKLVDVDENYVPPTNLDALPQTERAEAIRNTAYAHAIKEGRRRERRETQDAMGGYAIEQIKAKGLYQATHEREIERLNEAHFRDVKAALAHGKAVGVARMALVTAFLMIASGWGVWWMSSDLRAQIVAQQRTLSPHETWQPPRTNERTGFQ